MPPKSPIALAPNSHLERNNASPYPQWHEIMELNPKVFLRAVLKWGYGREGASGSEAARRRLKATLDPGG
jgi:hypothetical protein